MLEIKLDDNSRKVAIELSNKMEEILFNIGLKWQESAKHLVTVQDEVVTGRLRASLTFITNKRQSPKTGVKESKSKDYITGKSSNIDTLIVGSNVPYAAKNEFTNKKGAFVKPALLNNREAFKRIAEDILKK